MSPSPQDQSANVRSSGFTGAICTAVIHKVFFEQPPEVSSEPEEPGLEKPTRENLEISFANLVSRFGENLPILILVTYTKHFLQQL